MRIDTLDQQRTAAREALQQGGRVLVVGVRPGNIPQDLWTHPRLVFYASTDGKTEDRRPIPDNTRLILFTRFLKHGTHAWFRAQAQRRGIPCFPLLNNTGEIRALLDVARGIPPTSKETTMGAFNPVINAHAMAHAPLHADPPQPEPQPAPVSAPAGMVRAASGKFYRNPRDRKDFVSQFVREFLAHHKAETAGRTQVDIARLALPEAQSIGINTTLNSLCQAIRLVTQRRAPIDARDALPVPAPAPRVDAQHPSVVECTKLLDDAILTLQLLKDKLLEDVAAIDAMVKERVHARMRALMQVVEMQDEMPGRAHVD